MASLKNISTNFRFTGTVQTVKDISKALKENEQKEGAKSITKRLTLGVKESQSNSCFCDFTAMIPIDENTKLKKTSKEKDGNTYKKVEFPFKDRNLESIKKQIADFALLVVDLESDFTRKAEREKLRYEIMNIEKQEVLTDADKEKLESKKKEFEEKSNNVHTFVHEIDFIEFLHENMEVLKANRIRISGDYSINAYNKKFTPKFRPKKVELISSETDENGNFKYKSELLITPMDFYFDKDSVDDQLKKEKKIFVNGYIKGQQQNEDGEYQEVYFPQELVIDCTNIDTENEQAMKFVEFIKSTFKPKGKNLWHMAIQAKVKSGAEEKEISIDDLTPFQRMQVEIGAKTLEDYKEKGNIYGDTVTEVRFNTFLDGIEGFKDGAVDTELTDDEWTIANSDPVKKTSIEKEKEKEEDGNSEASKAIEKMFD